MLSIRNHSNKIIKSFRTSLLNNSNGSNLRFNNKLFIRQCSTSSTPTEDEEEHRYLDSDYTMSGSNKLDISNVDSKEYPELYHSAKWGLYKELEEEEGEDNSTYNEPDLEGIQLTEDKLIEADADAEKKGEDEIDLKELENLDMQTMLNELEDLILDVSPPLFPYIKYEIYDLHKDDPTFWDVKRLSKTFKIHPGRIVAIIRFIEIEKMEKANGTFDEELNALMGEYNYDYGYRIDDEGDDMGEDEHQKDFGDDPNYASPLGHNAHTLNRAYKGIGKSTKSRNSNARPDPIHEIPTQIPESYPEKPLYFRGPTFVVPRKKNVVFVDTSRHPITKKVNPDPMVLIQGIDGSLRTPSSTEKVAIMQKVRPQKVKRDYETVLNTPIKYKYQPKIKQTPKPVTEEKTIEESQ